MLADVPVLVAYEMTSIGIEVTQVSIAGHVVPAGYFARDTLDDWAFDIERSRDAAGFV